MVIQYPAIVSEGPDGCTASFPDFDWYAVGPVPVANLAASLSQALDGLISDVLASKGALPPPCAEAQPGTVAVPPSGAIAIKAALYLIKADQGVKNSELARNIGKSEGVVRQLLSPATPSKIQSVEDALATMGKRLVVSVTDTEG
ncbi:MAG: hypothetical protein OIF57_06785 [Marinobacterium sp.]|nr:hypothetical protein [Marinobacterium sp.]